MNASSEPQSLLVGIAGTVFFVSFLTVSFCVASLKYHIDETKIRGEKNIATIFKTPIPPEHILTPAGRRRVFIAKIAILLLVLSVGSLIVRNLVLGR